MQRPASPPFGLPSPRSRRGEERPARFALASGADRTRNSCEGSKRSTSREAKEQPRHPHPAVRRAQETVACRRRAEVKNQGRDGRSTARIHTLAPLLI
jgi:hypothetical protein